MKVKKYRRYDIGSFKAWWYPEQSIGIEVTVTAAILHENRAMYEIHIDGKTLEVPTNQISIQTRIF